MNLPAKELETGSLFVDRMSERARNVLVPQLRRISINHGTELYAAGAPILQVFFPIHCVISIVTDLSDGGTVETGLVGTEGMVGHAVALGYTRSQHRTFAQLTDSAYALPTDVFQQALQQFPDLQAHTARYAVATTFMLAQLIACNSHHPADERCARWLLMAHDRVAGDNLMLKQESLAQMLGVRRGSVTLAASGLQQAGYISYSRGHITIRDRAALETAACECYNTIEAGFKNILGYSVRKLPPPNYDRNDIPR